MAEDEAVYSKNWQATLKARERELAGISLRTERREMKPLGDAYTRYQHLSDLDTELDELVEFLRHNPMIQSPRSFSQVRRHRSNHPHKSKRSQSKQNACVIKGCSEPPFASYSCCEKCLKHHKLGPYFNRIGQVDYDGIDSTPQERGKLPNSKEPIGSIFDGGGIPLRYIHPVANPRGVRIP